MIMKTLSLKSGEIVRKSFGFIVFKHKRAFWFAVALTSMAIIFAFLGVPLIAAHQKAIIGLAAILKGHSYFVAFLHTLIIIAIYLGLQQWIEHVAVIRNISQESKGSAIKFLKIFTVILFLIMGAGHL